MFRRSDRRVPPGRLPVRAARRTNWVEALRFWLPFAAVVLAVWLTVPVHATP